MSQQGIKFNRNIVDSNFIPRTERQFLEFPNGDHDDIIDCISQAIEVFRKKRESATPTQKKQSYYIDSRTGKVVYR